MVKRLKSTLLPSAALALALLASSASPAVAVSPWWHASLGEAPTNLSAGVGKDEVQRLTVSATKGDYLLVEVKQFRVAVVPFNATASEVHQHLQAIYPSRNVGVSEEPSSEEDTRTYTITFPSQSVEPALAVPDNEELAVSYGGEPLSGGKSEVSATEIQKGAPDENRILLTAYNLGDKAATGESTLSANLPLGLKAITIEGRFGTSEGAGFTPLECSVKSLSCAFKGILPPYRQLEMFVSVLPGGARSGDMLEASASGGGAPSASAERPLALGVGVVPFGVEDYELTPEEEGGAPDTHAGSHPFQLTTTLALNRTSDPKSPPAPPKDLHFKLPPGLIGNPTSVPQCSDHEFLERPGNRQTDFCPADTAVGVATVTVFEPVNFGVITQSVPLFNLKPDVGEPVRFGFMVTGVPTILDTAVRSGEDYGVTVNVDNVPQTIAFLANSVTFWGVPGDPRHDNSRGWECVNGEFFHNEFPAEVPSCTAPAAELHPPPFLVMPTACGGALGTSVQAEPWNSDGGAPSLEDAEALPGLVGCNQLPFSAEVQVKPGGQAASSPTGLTVDVHVPQDVNENAAGLASSNVKDISVVMPEGMGLNPAAADGLQACSEAQIGFNGFKEFEPGTQSLVFTGALPEPLEPGVNFCPEAAKVGTAKVTSPLLPPGQPLEGGVYLATPAPSEEEGRNPYRTLVAMYIVVRDPISGTLVKIPGRVSLNHDTGRISATFEDTPQLPFEDAAITFFGGDRAPLAAPARCGTYATEATFTPWSGNPPVKSTSYFKITTGRNGGPCPGASLPFAPTLTAGTTNINAGAFSPFTMTLSRQDGEQSLSTVALTMPPGLAGILAGIPLCGEAQAATGSCPAASQLGHVTIQAGVGGSPITLPQPGKPQDPVYLTGPYKGAPFGLAIVVPAEAGPFNLDENGHPVVVRARIMVDPHTAQVSVISDPAPQMLQGVPADIRAINVTIDRPGFTFNPTSCEEMHVTAALGSAQGGAANLSDRFQAAECRNLAFKPHLTTSTAGKTSKAGGASLTVRVSQNPGESNIRRVDLRLPKILPARNETLNKACTEAQFNQNPAGCPEASRIGAGRAVTPILSTPLEGPAILVSHGGAAFPDVEYVLQGQGITVILDGKTFIDKQGYTYSHFETVPDAPISSFESVFPTGPHSIFAAYIPSSPDRSFCDSKIVTVKQRVTVRVHGHARKVTRTVKKRVPETLTVPTTITAQNGAVITQTTKVAITGCPKPKPAKKARRAGRHA
jgi:hypothetical protein